MQEVSEHMGSGERGSEGSAASCFPQWVGAEA